MADYSLENTKGYQNEKHLFVYKIYAIKLNNKKGNSNSRETLVHKEQIEPIKESKNHFINNQLNGCSFAHITPSIDFLDKTYHDNCINTNDYIDETNERRNVSSTDQKHLSTMNDDIYEEGFSFNGHKDDGTFWKHFNNCLPNPRQKSYCHYLIFDYLGNELSKLVYKNTDKTQLFIIKSIRDEKELKDLTRSTQESLIKEDINPVLLIKNDSSHSHNFKIYKEQSTSNSIKTVRAYQPYDPQVAKYLEYILIYKYAYV